MDERLPKKITRRTFLSTSTKLALGGAGVLAGSAGLFYYGSVQNNNKQGGRIDLPGHIVKLGQFDSLNATSQVKKVDYEATIEDAWVQKSNKGMVYVTKVTADELLIVSATCTHLGCYVLPTTEEQQGTSKDAFFRCPCHGAEFDQRGNTVKTDLLGLDTYKPIVAGGDVYIDILSPIKGRERKNSSA
jgi:menaquinol-cytochrome c reductase iron-sulfur subunit